MLQMTLIENVLLVYKLLLKWRMNGLVAAPLPHQRNTQSIKVNNLSKHTTNDTLEGIFQRFSSEVTAKVNQIDGVFNYACVNKPIVMLNRQ